MKRDPLTAEQLKREAALGFTPPLTPRMRDVLRALYDADKPLTPNSIGHMLGFHTGHLGNRRSNHCGRCMGPAQRVIFTLIGLRQRGMISYGRRPDGLSGTAYSLTSRGLDWHRAFVQKQPVAVRG